MEFLVDLSRLHKALLSTCLAAASGTVCTAQTVASVPRPLPASIERVLTWLPADTETILVANTSFAMPRFKNQDTAEPGSEISLNELTERFELLPLSLFELKHGLLQNYLMGQKVEFAIEGSRHFRRPASLFGEMPYEGCQIAVMAEATVSRRDSLLKQVLSVAIRVDSIAGQRIPVFEEKHEDEVWTTFVALPKPNLVLACTNRDYLRDVLERIGGKGGRRALSDSLEEWKFVGHDAPFWGLRHYDKSQAGRDPTSPFVDRNIFGKGDRQASGIAFRFDPTIGKVVTISYFSSTSHILVFLQKETPLSMKIEGVVDTTADLPVSLRQVAPGVAEIKYELGGVLPVDLFIAIAMGAFGHGVYF
jgi:hypothetical protein